MMSSHQVRGIGTGAVALAKATPPRSRQRVVSQTVADSTGLLPRTFGAPGLGADRLQLSQGTAADSKSRVPRGRRRRRIHVHDQARELEPALIPVVVGKPGPALKCCTATIGFCTAFTPIWIFRASSAPTA
jgi:hypothetical protein